MRLVMWLFYRHRHDHCIDLDQKNEFSNYHSSLFPGIKLQHASLRQKFTRETQKDLLISMLGSLQLNASSLSIPYVV